MRAETTAGMSRILKRRGHLPLPANTNDSWAMQLNASYLTVPVGAGWFAYGNQPRFTRSSSLLAIVSPRSALAASTVTPCAVVS